MTTSDCDSELRIASLLPAATDICVDLSLELVGVTHECDCDSKSTLILTGDRVKPNATQGEIHHQVQEALGTSTLYPILEDAWHQANPNLVFTQDLCAVCGPSSTDVCRINSSAGNRNIKTISLSPSNLEEVAGTIVTIADACRVSEQGHVLKNKFWSQIRAVQSLVKEEAATKPPKVFLLEWLDPPFDGGHWIPEMMDYAGVEQALPKQEVKSKAMTWQQVYDIEPDVVVVASCGFDLERNRRDVQHYWSHFEKLDKMGTRIYAADGDQYFARPGPRLSGGVAILAQAAYEEDKGLSAGLAALDFCPKRGQGWDRIHGVYKPEVADMEDLGATFGKVHQDACDRGDTHYVDPASGYRVFTEVAHKARGKCCGSGCRHCPYNHQNVKDKAANIKQPAFLHKATDKGKPIKVLFFSGGKDSFLTIRALMREEQSSDVILFTTFDASSRIVANQDIPIKDIQRQAAHLDLSLVGVPLHRGSGIDYVARMRDGTKLIEKEYRRPIHSLVFGDLHLEHIRSWRERRMGELGYPTEYPIWHAPYDDLLSDLERSEVPCVVSATTVDGVVVGTKFTREYSETLTKNGTIDGFGECGEFHSLAKVWEVERKTALGI